MPTAEKIIGWAGDDYTPEGFAAITAAEEHLKDVGGLVVHNLGRGAMARFVNHPLTVHSGNMPKFDQRIN